LNGDVDDDNWMVVKMVVEKCGSVEIEIYGIGMGGQG
jgi:hypothetical protein